MNEGNYLIVLDGIVERIFTSADKADKFLGETIQSVVLVMTSGDEKPWQVLISREQVENLAMHERREAAERERILAVALGDEKVVRC